jgi:hypothetical protein
MELHENGFKTCVFFARVKPGLPMFNPDGVIYFLDREKF